MLAQEVIEKEKRITHRQTLSLGTGSIVKSGLRLDAGYFTRDVVVAQITLRDSGFSTILLEKACNRIFMPPRSKRLLVSDLRQGTPFLMPSELFNFPLTSTKRVIAHKIKDIADWFIKSGWILVTRSGLTGVPLYATDRFENFVISDDAIRMVPESDIPSGYIYCFLATWTGQTLLTRKQFGVAVEHIQPHQVKTVPIPILPKDVQEIFHNFIVIANRMRDEAEKTLHKAHEVFYEKIGLERTFEVTEPKAECFTVESESLNLRLDASYHEPTVKRILSALSAKSSKKLRDSNLAKVTLPMRFKRTYVSKEHGLPFLQGGSIAQIKPIELKFISRKMTKNLNDLIIHKNWILITRSGTVGRVCLVPSYWDGWSASDHIIRIIPNEANIHPGYLVAFLQSPYGKAQLTARISGGIVDEITTDDVKDLMIPIPDEDVQRQIGELVSKAYEMKEMARIVEEQTISTLDALLRRAFEPDAKFLQSALEETIGTFLNTELSIPLIHHDFDGDRIPWESIKKEHGMNV